MLGHIEEAVRELCEFARAVVLQRLEYVAIAFPDARRPIDQFAHRPGDGAGKHQPDRDRRQDDGQSREDELAALLIEMVENVARRSRGIDHAGNMVVDDNRHRRKHVHANAAADRINRRWRLVRNAGSQRGAILPLQRRCDFLDVGKRLPNLLTSGDHDAMRIEDPKAGQRDFLRLQDDRHQPRADRDIGRIRRCVRRQCIGPSPEQIIAGQIQRRPDRRQAVFRIRARLRRNFSAEGDPRTKTGLDFLRIDGCQHPALGDQLSLSLVNQLIVVKTEEEKPHQRQRGHRGQHGENDKPE